MSVIETVEQLEAIYGVTNDASIVKVADHVTPLYRVFIERRRSPRSLPSDPRGSTAAARRSLRLRPHS